VVIKKSKAQNNKASQDKTKATDKPAAPAATKIQTTQETQLPQEARTAGFPIVGM